MSTPFLSAQDAVPQDWSRLQQYLARQGLQLDADQETRQFAGGFGNLNYLVWVNGEKTVLRRPPLGVIPIGANDMAREYRILSNLWRSFPLAPRALHYCEDSGVLGAHFLLMEYRQGLVIGGKLPASPSIDVAQRHSLSEQLVDILVQLHQVDPSTVGLEGLGKPEGMLQRAVNGWQKRAVHAYDGVCPPAVTRLHDWLNARIPTSQRVSLLHSDYKLDNVIWIPESLEPVAVIDWDMGTRGDPLTDLATLLSYWTELGDPQAMHQLAQMPTHETGFLSRQEVMNRYALRTGIDLSDFDFYRVLAQFKLAVVFQQLHAKFRRGEVTDERYRSFGSLSAGLLDFASEVAFAKHQ